MSGIYTKYHRLMDADLCNLKQIKLTNL